MTVCKFEWHVFEAMYWILTLELLIFTWILLSNRQCLCYSQNAQFLLHLFLCCINLAELEEHSVSKCRQSPRRSSLSLSFWRVNPANPSRSSLPLASPIPISGEYFLYVISHFLFNILSYCMFIENSNKDLWTFMVLFLIGVGCRSAIDSSLFKQWLKNLQSETGILGSGGFSLKRVLVQVSLLAF